jgi:3-dehydroquinate dehydratase / shikimate dehydrogenase
VVCNRTRERADRLVEDLQRAFSKAAGKITAVDLESLTALRCHAYVNCTSVGMAGGAKPDASPIPVERLEGVEAGTVFFDTVYTPLRTPMLAAAAAAGCTVIEGVEMFVRQAAEQFEAWTSKPAPVGLFDRVARESLASAR